MTRFLICCLTLSLGQAGTVLHLKNRSAEAAAGAVEAGLPDPGKRLLAGVSRVIMQFERAPDAEAIAAAGGRVLGPVPEDGAVVLFGDGANPAALAGVVYVGRLGVADKVSGLIAGDGPLVVEFFPDVTAEQASTIVRRTGLREEEAAGLLPYQKLVRGGAAAARALAEWNETAYVFPGVDIDIRTAACRGSGLETGRMGQYVASSASSWSARKEAGADLGYFVEPVPEKLGEIDVRGALERALAEWERFTHLGFQKAGARGDGRTLSLRIGAGDHGDAWPFDGAGRVLAHAFYPAPIYAEPLAGDVHLDLDEQWRAEDAYSVLLHEVGHALGLVHADDPTSVMYPMYRRVKGLGAVDIAAIRELYGAKKTTEEEGGAELGLEIAEVMRNVGEFAPGELVALAGKAWGEGTLKVRWRYGSGGGWIPAVGAYAWMAPVVPVFSADEEIVVEVRDGTGRSERRTVRILREE